MMMQDLQAQGGPVPSSHRSDKVQQGKKRKRAWKRGFVSIPDRTVIQSALVFWECCDTPVSLGLWLRAKYGLWQEIADFRIRPESYRFSRLFQLDYAASNYLRKYPGLPISVDRKANAKEKFLASEARCAETNLRIREWLGGRLNPKSLRVGSILYDARSKIRNLLGEVNLDEVSELMRWGPGATSATAGAFVSAYNKFDVAPECTLGALPYARAAINCCPTWAQSVMGVDYPCSLLDSAFRVIPGNRVTYVPKDAQIDRVIAIEPHMNIYMQLGVGGVFRRRLYRVGVDLNNQTGNQIAAKEAIQRNLATVDLSSASDTISRELVQFLLPHEWFILLEGLRSVNGDVGDKRFVRYEKFSSMGNGFTFELESLIFWALSRAVLQRLHLDDTDLHVYGDDIVVPAIAYPLLVEVFDFAGFEVNRKKSFASGLFFESCGKHFFGGLDVTPVYCNGKLVLINELFGLINQITAFASRSRSDGNPSLDFRPVRDFLVGLVPKRDRLFGPLGYGDGVIHSSFDECVPFCRTQKNWVEGFTFLHWLPVPKKQSVSRRSALPWGLDRLSNSSDLRPHYVPLAEWAISESNRLALFSRGQIPLRGSPVRFKLARLEVPRPTYVGVWL